jgi:glycosyltransferase involved in cell wall biosynthesis
MRVLHDLGQASLGANGIASDTRNIASMLMTSGDVSWTGLLTQHAGVGARRLHPEPRTRKSEDMLMASMFMGAVSGSDGDDPNAWLVGRALAKVQRIIETNRLRYRTAPISDVYSDAIWRNYFQPTSPSNLRPLVSTQPMRWTNLTHAAVMDRSAGRFTFRPRLDTAGFDVFLTAEPKPIKVSPGTRIIHRYHDAIPIYASDTMNDSNATKYHFLLTDKALTRNNAPLIVCNSEPTRLELLHVWPDLSEHQIRVVPCAVNTTISQIAETLSVCRIVQARLSERLIEHEDRRIEILGQIREKVPTEFPYILSVATLEPKKNIPAIVSAYERARLAIPGLKLIIVGNRGWRADGIERALRPYFLMGDLYHLEYVPHRELQALYKQTHCLVFPSVAEGFGLPPVEALACGAPSVCSDIPSLRWVMGRSALYADPYDPGEIASRVISLTDRHNRTELLKNAREVLDRFCFEAVALQWEKTLQEL